MNERELQMQQQLERKAECEQLLQDINHHLDAPLAPQYQF